jgi:rhomboid protease GluP
MNPLFWVSGWIVALNVIVWLANIATGLDPMNPRSADLLEWGANFLPATELQPWRLMSATLLHGGLLHLAMNMWALWDTGRICEQFYGRLQFLLIYGASGLMGSLASLFSSAAQGVSVGASGAIFGVVGALLGALFTKSDKLNPQFVLSMRRSMLFFAGFSLFLGFTVPHIDNSAHIGGLVTGAILGVVLAERFDRAEFQRQALPRALVAIAIVGASGAGLWRLAIQG